MIKKIILNCIFAVLLCVLLSVSICSAEADYQSTYITPTNFSNAGLMFDGSERDYAASWGEASVSVKRDDGISSLYVVFDRLPPVWCLTDESSGNVVECGKNTFLHEFIDVEELFGYCPTEVKMSFNDGVQIAELYGFGPGELPDWVQIWEPALEEADLLMISSHSDDEQLFFAGVLPYYAGELGLKVQVAYLVSHFDTRMRPHEQLDGLWEVGVRNYPIISEFPDLYSESLQGAINAFAGYGYSVEDFSEYLTTVIRMTKPLVIVTHDINGEYGHGTHLLCVKALSDCLDHTADPEYFSDSADKYGVWDVEKVYLHLYGENQLVMNFDKPLEKFGGLTAFQVSQKGFSHHTSQHWTWFYKWIYGENKNITSASQITTYSPLYYGLYRTTVGYDVIGGDFFENVKTYDVRSEEAQAPETDAPETNLPEDNIVPESSVPVSETETPDDNDHVDNIDEKSGGIQPVTIVIAAVALMMIILIVSTIMLKTPNKKRRR